MIFYTLVSKKSAAYELCHVLTPSINSSLLLKHRDLGQFFMVRKQVVVARSEIRAVSRVVKQLPVEMLQQCLGASNCMWTRSVMEEHNSYRMSAFHAFCYEWPYAFFFFSILHKLRHNLLHKPALTENLCVSCINLFRIMQ
jgi:hypothetical protein